MPSPRNFRGERTGGASRAWESGIRGARLAAVSTAFSPSDPAPSSTRRSLGRRSSARHTSAISSPSITPIRGPSRSINVASFMTPNPTHELQTWRHAASRSRQSPGLRRQPRLLYRVNCAGLIILGMVTADTHGAHDVVAAVLDQNAAGDREDAPPGGAGQSHEERGRLLRAFGQSPSTDTHAQCSPSFPLSNVRPENSRAVLPLEGDEMPARIQHRNR